MSGTTVGDECADDEKKIKEEQRLLAASQKASTTQPTRTPLALDFEHRGIETVKNHMTKVWILANNDGGETAEVSISRDGSEVIARPRLGDRMLMYECTVARSYTARGLALAIPTLPL
jgi:hypothetical protein